MKKLLYCWFFVNNLNSVNNSLINRFFRSNSGTNCPRFIQIDLASLGQFRKTSDNLSRN